MNLSKTNWLTGIVLSAGFLGMYLTSSQVQAQSSDLLIQNGSFSEWQDDKPVGWTVGVGATDGAESPTSKISRASSVGGLKLTGTASTRLWWMLSQKAEVSAGDTLQLKFKAQAKGLKREARQRNNCYVGVFLRGKDGKPVAVKTAPIHSTEFVEDWQIFRVPDNVTVADVIVFLSKTGILSVQDVSLQNVRPADSFDVLANDMDRHYSYFEHKNIDWSGLVEKYRERAKNAPDTDTFVKVVAEMLAEMKDVHTWLIHENRRTNTYIAPFRVNYSFDQVDSRLKKKKQLGRFGMVGITEEGFGYVRISGLAGIQPNQIRSMMTEVEKLFDCPGIIVDLRRNTGGAETVAMPIASLFTDKPRIYAKQKYRSGPKHSHLVESGQRSISPREGRVYTRPMICLVGPGAISSAEGFAMMMKSLPHCTLMGQPTRGSSGNPAPVELPNGVDVFYSRWMSLLPDGTPIEDVGVAPDIVVEHRQGKDPTFAEAIEFLSEKTGGAK